MSKTFPAPVEVPAEELDDHELAKRLGRAVAAQHPGVQVAERYERGEGDAPTKYALDIKHPCGDWTLTATITDKVPTHILENTARVEAMSHYTKRWEARLAHVIRGVQVTNAGGDDIGIERGIMGLLELVRRRPSAKVMFVGNGGSAAIASHMAEDFTKNGKIRSVTFNDAALITCYANDYSWIRAFAECVNHQGVAGDVLVAISSSGESLNIVAAAEAATAKAIVPVTFSGFKPDNLLRSKGQINFWVPSSQYGFVETAHAAILHMALDIGNGWAGQP